MGRHKGGGSDDSGNSNEGHRRQPQSCGRCRGSGTVQVTKDGQSSDGEATTETKTCPLCKGSGNV
jgi:hypothetical protein